MGLKHGPSTVLYVANAAKIGGGNKVLMDLIANLDRGWYSPHLVSPGRGPLTEWATEARIPWSISAGGDWSESTRLMKRTLELARLMLTTRARIVHSAAPLCYRSAGIAGALTGTKRVCHLGFPPEAGELKRAFVAGPDVVIGCYEGQARQHEEEIRQLAPTCRVVGIPNGVDTARFGIEAPAPDVVQLRPPDGVVVAILGHISQVKGYPAFIAAAAQLVQQFRSITFVAVGGEHAEPGAREIFEARVRALGVSQRFQFLGFRRDVAAVLRAVDIVCLPSLAEGFPLAVLEAMASERPVIATPVGGVSEAITDQVTGLLVRPGDPSALAAALKGLIESPARRRALGQAARGRVLSRFSLTRFAAAVQQIYKQVDTSSPDTDDGRFAA